MEISLQNTQQTSIIITINYFISTTQFVDEIVKKVIKLGPGFLLCKVDINRTFCQLKGGPRRHKFVWVKAGFVLHIDQSVPFG